MRIAAGNAQDIGARESQEDSFGFSSLEPEAQKRLGGVCMVLCDGMGGLAKGGEASRAAVTAALSEFDRRHPSDLPAETLHQMLRAAQRAVHDVSSEAGTTLVACIVANRRLYWVSVGDSRIYLCRPFAKPQQLTEDDTVATSRRKAGGDRALEIVDQNVNLEALTAYVGAPEMPNVRIRTDGLMLRPGDRIIASSDGLHRTLDIEQLDRLGSAGRAMTSARKLVQAVLRQRNAAQDNATVAILAIQSSVPYGETFRGKLGTAMLAGLAAVSVVLLLTKLYPVFFSKGHVRAPKIIAVPVRTEPVSEKASVLTGPEVPIRPIGEADPSERSTPVPHPRNDTAPRRGKPKPSSVPE